MRQRHQNTGFTLVELLVSIGIALLLIVGVNTVFKVTSQTVGAGESVLTATRDSRTVFQTFLADMNSIVPVPTPGATNGDAPCFIIRSEPRYAYRNITDQQTATSRTDPSSDTNLFKAFPSNQVPPTMINYRNHRLDRIGFFARGVFARQTTSDGNQYVSTTAGNEAWVWYGHSEQPNKNNLTATGATWQDPGLFNATANPFNYYANDWMLCRMAVIMIPYPIPNPSPTEGNLYQYLVNPTPKYAPDNQQDLHPFDNGIVALNTLPYSMPAISDLAPESIALWGSTHRPPVDGSGYTTGGIQAYSCNVGTNGHGAKYVAPSGASDNRADWWSLLTNYRYQASPFILPSGTTTKITPATLSQCMPDMIRGCSQFVVEYAGNYYTKDANGNAAPFLNDGKNPPSTAQTVPTPDPTGQVDFIMVNGVRQTRWYGFPRLTTSGIGVPSTIHVNATSGDVVPLRDVLESLVSGWGQYADAERFIASGLGKMPAVAHPSNDYWSSAIFSANGELGNKYVYTAAWGPDVRYQAFPKMIRITVEMDDHEGRLSLPQRYEFIFDIQQ